MPPARGRTIASDDTADMTLTLEKRLGDALHGGESTARAYIGSKSALDAAIERAADALLHAQQQDGHWVFELEADATIPSEYVLLLHFLGESDGPLEKKIATYLRRRQGAHGGWALVHGGTFDLSATVKAYFALKMIGDHPEEPHMVRAREAILAHGGAGASNVFTRCLLALYGIVPWHAIPAMPVEIMLLPRWFPFHLQKISYWGRTVLVPLLVLQALRPRARNPRGIRIDELFKSPASELRLPARAAHQSRGWFACFHAVDAVLHHAERFFPRKLRKAAIAKAVSFVTERLNGEHGLGAIFPAMANTVVMLDTLGYARGDEAMALARRALEKLLVVSADEAYCQPCVSPVWDTALACHTLLEVGAPRARRAAAEGLTWLRDRQVLEVAGDWTARRKSVRSGGWPFQYENDHYPDLDDTAVVVMAMERAVSEGTARRAEFTHAISRAHEWVIGLQSANGGWAAFDADNTHYYLNHIPFADHGALLDPPTADVTARCVSMLAQMQSVPGARPLLAGLRFLRETQERDGSWYGRWGMNYIYGTWSALFAFEAARVPTSSPEVRRAAAWLVSIQNDDGGWGESVLSYALERQGHEPAPSTPSQTAWALLGLMSAGELRSPSVKRGIAYLLATQRPDGFWTEPEFTATGFPRVFYLRYHGYARYFPLWALARYRTLLSAQQP
jgi:squalene-hopene/tetraprenyl-beta-curcumene cyclase